MRRDRSGRVPGLAELLLTISAHPAIIRTMLKAAFFEPERYVTSEMIEHAREAIGSPANRRVLAALSARYDETDLRHTGLRARLAELRTPTLLVWGEADQIFKLANGEQAQREIPGAHLVVLPRCGHFPQLEAARQFHGLVLGFLAAQTPLVSQMV
jgi:pimeloyl-ACP methyl ester carboxylesterase